jgi:hypothetical protein
MITALGLLLAAAPDVNLLSLENGGVPIETPPTYGGTWSVQAMFDGVSTTGWCSAEDAKGPFTFTFELEQRSLLTSVDADDTSAEETTNPGISTRALEIWVSTKGPYDGYTLAAKLPMPKSGSAGSALPKDTLARWVRVVVKGNWGHPHYTELMELAVRGHGLEPPVKRSVAGTWSLEHGTVLRLNDGDLFVSGCEATQSGEPQVWLMRGEQRGRVARFEWREAAAENTGTAVVALTDDGTLHGVWKSSSGGSGLWVGSPRVTDPVLDCAAAAEEARLLKRLANEPRGATLHGVGFEGDELKLQAENDLAPLRRALAGSHELKARVLVLGRAADPAADELKRTERRAQKIVQYLLATGASSSQLDTGFGLMRFGAAVQLEPRVEVQLLRSP